MASSTDFAVIAFLKALVLPPAGPLIVALAGLVILPRRPQAGRALVALGVLPLLALSIPVVSGTLAWIYSAPPPFDTSNLRGAGAIVILGGGVRRHAPEYGGETLGTLTLERVRYGARLARETGLPVLVSGGNPASDVPEAVLMQDALSREFGVRPQWIERDSVNTRENVRNSARLLAAAGISEVILVAHAFDVPRAVAEFRAVGITALPAATSIPGSPFRERLQVSDFLPSLRGLEQSYFTLYEMLAYARTLARGAG